MRAILFLFSTFSLLLAGACTQQSKEESGPVVLAASSLQDALSEASHAWTEQGYAEPVLSFAATPALARQIEAGAPADLFISADEQWMDYLARGGHIKGQTRRDLLGNSLVLVGPVGGGEPPEGFDARKLVDMLGQGRLALADPHVVPAGRYARQALESLGVWDDLSARAIPAENVRLALELVARKDAAFGAVYQTDAKAQPQVRVLYSFAAGHHAPILYPAALVSQSAHPDAEDFIAFLSSSKATAIFRGHGFTVPVAR